MPRCQGANRVRVPGFRSRQHREASHSPQTVGRADSRSAPRGGRAQAGREASVPRVVCPKPIHPDFAARGAGDLKKSDPEHHLLRRGHFHRIHDVAFGHHGLGHLHGAVGGHRIAGERH